MRLGIDWVASGAIFAAFLLSLVRVLPLNLRYFIIAAACFFVGVWRLRLGTTGYNAVFIGLAVVLGVTYLVRGFQAPKRQ